MIYDIHQDLYAASGAGPGISFHDDPYAALREANAGYLSHYHENRAVMRAFIEASMVDARYRDMWWFMRERHINRFVAALAGGQPVFHIMGAGKIEPASLTPAAVQEPDGTLVYPGGGA